MEILYYIGLWIISIVISFVAFLIKSEYKLAYNARNFFLTIFMLATLFLQILLVYQTAQNYSSLCFLPLIAIIHYWQNFVEFYPNGDAAGNGMARAFRSIINTCVSLVLGIILFLLIKFTESFGLNISLILITIIGLINILNNYNSYVGGDSFRYNARFFSIKENDYRKMMFRSRMTKKNDPWHAIELDASPNELEFWNFYSTRKIKVEALKGQYFIFLKGIFNTNNQIETLEKPYFGNDYLSRSSFSVDENADIFVPNHILLVWYDCQNQKTYKIEGSLPDFLNHYFDEKEKFYLDDIEFRLIPNGSVLMFHNKNRQIHNIMIDYPLQGIETNEYQDILKEYITRKNININKYFKSDNKLASNIKLYNQRFNYKIKVLSNNQEIKISKYICNFFNLEKLLFSDTWKNNFQFARLKDVFIRFNNNDIFYSCFLFFSKQEIIKAFEMFNNSDDDNTIGEFVIKVGCDKKSFEFYLKIKDKTYNFAQTEIRLYRNYIDDRSKLVFKNYRGNRKNNFDFLA